MRVRSRPGHGGPAPSHAIGGMQDGLNRPIGILPEDVRPFFPVMQNDPRRAALDFCNGSRAVKLQLSICSPNCPRYLTSRECLQSQDLRPNFDVEDVSRDVIRGFYTKPRTCTTKSNNTRLPLERSSAAPPRPPCDTILTL